MTFKENMIMWVNEQRTAEGITYGYYVRLRDYKYTAMDYGNRDEKGRKTTEEFPFERLPKSVKSFIEKHNGEPWDVCDGFTFIRYK